jgi:hypothetical protein
VKKIKFYPVNLEIAAFAPHPIPTGKLIPDWYKDLPGYADNNKFSFRGNPENGGGFFQNTSAKKCMSIFDTISTGYYLLLPADIFFDTTGEHTVYKWRNPAHKFIIPHSSEQLEGYPRGDQYAVDQYRWIPSHMVETPKGYSVLVTHPHHRQDLPFYTLPGIVDTDNMLSSGALPFELKKGYKGIIKQGTPIAQIMPFKREAWTHKVMDYHPKRYMEEAQTINSRFSNAYKEKYWARKKFK